MKKNQEKVKKRSQKNQITRVKKNQKSKETKGESKNNQKWLKNNQKNSKRLKKGVKNKGDGRPSLRCPPLSPIGGSPVSVAEPGPWCDL